MPHICDIYVAYRAQLSVFLKSASFVSFTDKNFKCLTEIKILSVRMSDTKIQDILHRTRTCLTENYTVWHDVSFCQTQCLTSFKSFQEVWAIGPLYVSYNCPILLVIRSVSDVLRAQSRFVKFVGGEAAGRTPYTFYIPTLGPKYVSNRPYNEFITPTTFI